VSVDAVKITSLRGSVKGRRSTTGVEHGTAKRAYYRLSKNLSSGGPVTPWFDAADSHPRGCPQTNDFEPRALHPIVDIRTRGRTFLSFLGTFQVRLLRYMELSGGALDIPTGRVVAFSNSIVFQSGAGLFKQIPGASFVWHEITVSMPRGVDFARIKEKLLGAVTEILSDYRYELDRQYREMERTMISFPSDGLHPRIRLRVTSSVVEAIIDFPVDARHGGEIDERVSNAVLKAIEGESKPGPAGSDVPEIHLCTDLSASDVAG